MCLITDIKEKFIAQEDGIVYKHLEYNLQSPVQGFKYEEEKLYKSHIRKCNLDHADLADNTCHEYINRYYSRDWRFLTQELIAFDKGFHSYESLERAKMEHWLGCAIFKCTLPKGTEYYKDATGCIVSNQIIINHEVSNPT